MFIRFVKFILFVFGTISFFANLQTVGKESKSSKFTDSFITRLQHHTIIVINVFTLEIHAIPTIIYNNKNSSRIITKLFGVRFSKIESITWIVDISQLFNQRIETIAYLPIHRSRDTLVIINNNLQSMEGFTDHQLNMKYIFIISKSGSIQQYQGFSKEITQKWRLIDNPDDYQIQRFIKNFHKSCIRLIGLPFDVYHTFKGDKKDERLSKLQSIIFHYYLAKVNLQLTIDTEMLIDPAELIAKYIINQLNLSVSTCGDEYYSHSNKLPGKITFDLDNRESKYDVQLLLSGMSTLLDIGDTLEIKFLSPQVNHRYNNFTGILGPLDWKIILNLFTVAIILILVIKLFLIRFSIKINTATLIGVIIRPLVHQWHDDKLSSKKSWFRLILATWLMCCLIIPGTYRGALVTYLMKSGEGSSWLQTFEELGVSKTPLLVLKTYPNIENEISKMLNSELKRRSTVQSQKAFQNILHKMDVVESGTNQLKLLTEGLSAIIGTSNHLESFCKTMELIYWKGFYKVSKDWMKSPQFWAIAHGFLEDDIFNAMIWLTDYGVPKLLRHYYDLIMKIITGKQIQQAIVQHSLTNLEILNDEKSRSGPKSLKFRHVVPVIAVLLMGICISLIVFVGETIYDLLNQRRNQTVVLHNHWQIK